MVINDQSETINTSMTMLQNVIKTDGTVVMKENSIVAEHFLDLIIDERLAARLVCTPSDFLHLVVGRLITEGYIKRLEDVDSIYICKAGSRAKVFLARPEVMRPVVDNEPTCCTGNQVFLKNTSTLQKLDKADWETGWIFGLADAFASGSLIHRSTKGTHSCYLSVGGAVVYGVEDIGRHNAIDKAVGYAAMNGLDRHSCILYTTGRISTDMVKKVIVAGIPVLVSKAVPTTAAIEMAQHYNLTLICKAWPDSFEVFSKAG